MIGSLGGLGQDLSVGGSLVSNVIAPGSIDCSSFINWLLYPSCGGVGNPLVYGNKYPEPPIPPTVPSPPIGSAALTVPPASGEEANNTIDILLADQMNNWQQQSQDFASALSDNLNSGTNWVLVAIVATGAFLILKKL